MIKRIFLFVLMNILVLAWISLILFVIESIFWIRVSGYWYDVISLLIFSAVVWFVGAFISLFTSKWMAKSMYWIEIIDDTKVHSYNMKIQEIYRLVKNIALKNSISTPEFWIYQSNEPNAFATWATKNSSLVAVSSWLVETMSIDEIEWVIWHEMAHILNWDMVTMTLLQWILNTFVVFLSRILWTIIDNYFFRSQDSENENYTPWIWFYVISFILEIIFWIFASILLMTFSRYREYRADEGSSYIVWKEKMIAWLRKLKKIYETDNSNDDWQMATLKISSKSKFLTIFASHPDLDDRIKNLENKNLIGSTYYNRVV